VEIAERTSWSCAHGIERWRADCGCRLGDPKAPSQAWRAPLRAAIDWLRDALAAVYEREGGDVLRDPWGARNRWIDCLLEPARIPAFLAAEARGPVGRAVEQRALRALALARHALLMQTSCGWFFDDLSGIEPRLILRQAARAIDLAAEVGTRLEPEFLARLEPARSNGREGGGGVYRRAREAA
jgi:alpha-amylase/alpha-mannosidase (GH57 family)